jgi:hypothetical protein
MFMRLLYPISIFLFSQIIHASENPSLEPSCDFIQFQRERMPSERERFWRRTRDYEFHDLASERRYNSELIQQINNCYEKPTQFSSLNCNFSGLESDVQRINSYADTSAYYPWQISMDEGRDLVYSTMVRFQKKLARDIRSCFKKENLQRIDLATFRTLFEAVSKLSDTWEKNFPYNTAVVTGYGRDADHTYIISLNRFILTVDEDGKISVREQ